VETGEAARRWAETWERAWRDHDPAEIAGLYAENAHFRSQPFRAPEPAREYAERVFAQEVSAEAQFGEPIVDGDRAAVEWRARTQLVDGGEEDLVGVSLLRFGPDGLVTEQRDIWCQQ